MRLILLSLISCINLICCAYGQANKKTILCIFPHPDDENMIGHVLAKYARLGHHVYIIIATDGKGGTRVTKIPEGDSLGKIRQQETICACEKLKINPPIYLHLERLDTKIGVRPYLNNHKKLLEELKVYIQKLQQIYSLLSDQMESTDIPNISLPEQPSPNYCLEKVGLINILSTSPLM